MPLAKLKENSGTTSIFGEYIEHELVDEAYNLLAVMVQEHKTTSLSIDNIVSAFSGIFILGTRFFGTRKISYVLDQIYERNLWEKRIEFALENPRDYNGLVFISPGKKRHCFNRIRYPEALKG